MLEFVEKAYFFELERKTKLQTALAFPISMVVVGTALIGNAVENWDSDELGAYVTLVLIGLATLSFAFFVANVGRFLIGRTYRYVWTADQALTHFRGLEKFSQAFPEAPRPEITFREQLTTDLAACAERNAFLNDQRSTNLYYANVSAYVFILAALIAAGIVSIVSAFT